MKTLNFAEKAFANIKLIAVLGLFVAITACTEDVPVSSTDSDLDFATLELKREDPGKDRKEDQNKDRKNANGPIPIECFTLTAEQMESFRTSTARYKESMATLQREMQAELSSLKENARAEMAEIEARIKERDMKIRELKKAAGDDDNGAKDGIRIEINELNKEFHEEKNSLIAQVKDGTLERKEAGAMIRELTEEHRKAVKALKDSVKKEDRDTETDPEILRLLEENKADKDALKAINDRIRAAASEIEAKFKAAQAELTRTYYAAFRDMLDARQQELFDQWVKTGRAC